MVRRWSRRRTVVTAAVAEALGLAVAYVAGWWAFFALPPTGLFASTNSTGTRIGGAVAAVLAAVALPAGLWVVAVVRRNAYAGTLAALVGAACLAVAAAWATG